ncbi:hypothetical protein [Rhodococcus sp. NPDC076796]|uniref:hypothetical protein n=1 Tax=Rhodococcus sp. NPDC076796 TaxID=3154859 RepID=UPI003450E5AE
MNRTVTRAAGLGATLAAVAILGAGVAAADAVPDGVYLGTVEGTQVPVWEGKTISGGGTSVINRLNGLDRFPADVYAGPSIYDGSPVTHIDYRVLSPELGMFVHDEVTPDANDPNRLNGRMYFTAFDSPIPVLSFTLTK